LAETTDPANDNNYTVESEILCHRCVARETLAEKFKDHRHPGAVLATIRPKNAAERQAVADDTNESVRRLRAEGERWRAAEAERVAAEAAS
jgi:hypothetical protein